MSLFSNESTPEVLALPDAEIALWHHFLSAKESDYYFTRFREELAWEQSEIFIHGRKCLIPRLNAWYGEPGASYIYSGRRFDPCAWTESLRELLARVEAVTGSSFNSVLANLYRDGADSVAWHSDDEPELGNEPVIASISLGGARKFSVKHKQGAHPRVDMWLPSGSLLVMRGRTQHAWHHQIPKTKMNVAPRINLTFRWVR